MFVVGICSREIEEKIFRVEFESVDSFLEEFGEEDSWLVDYNNYKVVYAYYIDDFGEKIFLSPWSSYSLRELKENIEYHRKADSCFESVSWTAKEFKLIR